MEQAGFHEPKWSKVKGYNRETHEFFLEADYEPQRFTYEQYAQIAQIRQQEPIIAFISKVFHTKLIGIKKIT